MNTLNKNYDIFSTDKFMKKVTSLSFETQNKTTDYSRKFQLTNFIKVYFDFAFVLGLSPFRFVRERGPGKQLYRIKKWIPQQVFCAAMHILCIFILIGEVRRKFPEDMKSLSSNPAPYFRIVLGIWAFSYKLVTMKRFWMNQHDYLNVLNTVLKMTNLPSTRSKLTSPNFTYFLCGINTMQIMSCFFGGYDFINPSWEWSPSWWFRRLIIFGQFSYGFGDRYKSKDAPQKITFGNAMIAIPTMFGYFQRCVQMFFCDLILLCAALTLWCVVSSFSKEIQGHLQEDDENHPDEPNCDKIVITVNSKRNLTEDWAKIYRRFQAIQRLSSSMNNALGNQVTWYMAEALMYYSINMNSFLLANDWYKRFNLTYFYATTFSIFFISADICNKFEALKIWLGRNDNIQKVPTHEATLVLHEMLVKDVGIRGSDMFTLTFPLVAGFISLIITFFIINVQQNEMGEP